MPKIAPLRQPRAGEGEALFAAYLAERGLTPEQARRSGMEYLPDARLAHPKHRPLPALGILYSNADGSPRRYEAGGASHELHRVRYLGPPPLDAEGKPLRYSQPKGSPVAAYFPHGVAGIDWPAIVSDPARFVLITEGEVKALCACLHGFPTIGLGGVWNFIAEGRLLSELEPFVRDGRPVGIVFDSDAAEKPHVMAAQRRLAAELCKRGAAVHIVMLLAADNGGKQGLDDFLVAKGSDAFWALLEASPEVDPAKAVPIQLTPSGLNENLAQLDRAFLASDLPVFERGGRMVYVAAAGASGEDDDVRRAAETPVIREATVPVAQQLAMKAATFQKWNERKGGWVDTQCPPDFAAHYLEKADGRRLRPLNGIVEAPTIAPDGALIQTPGYHAASGILYLPSAEFPPVPDAPTREDARRALDVLRRPVRGFTFASPEAEAVWLANVLTAVVRRSLRAAPLFAYSAPVMGSGKSLAAGLVGIIATGHEPAVMSQGRSAEEDRKRLLSVLLRGDAVVQIDNCELPIEGDALCSIITEPVWQERILGRSETASVPTNCTMMATGNNLILKGDMSTRALVCRIEPREERPEERRFDWDARAETLANRPDLVAAALTIIRAYFAAGCPDVGAKPFGRFEQWQRFVQFPLIWAGAADPYKTRELIDGSDPEREELARLFHLWRQVFGDAPVRTNDFTRLADVHVPNVALPEARAAAADKRELFDFLCELSGAGGRDLLDPKRLGRYLAKKEGRQSGGLQLVKGFDKKSKTATWRLIRQEGH